MLLIKKYHIFKIYTYFLFKGLLSISSSESLKVVSISLTQTLFAKPKIKKIRWCVLRLTIFRENVPILSIPVPEGNSGSIGSKFFLENSPCILCWTGRKWGFNSVFYVQTDTIEREWPKLTSFFEAIFQKEKVIISKLLDRGQIRSLCVKSNPHNLLAFSVSLKSKLRSWFMHKCLG